MSVKGLSRSFRAKMILIIISIVLVSVGVVTAISIYSMQNQMEEQISEKQMLLAESFAEIVKQFFDDAQGMLKAAARLPDVRNMLSASLISQDYNGVSQGMDFVKRETLRNIIEEYGSFSYMQQVIPSGLNLLIEPYEYQLSLQEMDLSASDWFKGAIDRKDSYVSEVHISPSMQQPVVAFAQPLIAEYDDQVIGVLMGAMTLERLNNLCAQLTFGETGYAYLVDQRGVCAAHRDQQLTSNITRLTEIPMVQKVLAREAGVGRFFDPRSEKEVFSAFTPVGDTGWGLIVVQDLDEAFARVRQTRTIIMVVALLMMAVYGFVAFLVANSITGPIKQLNVELDKMSKGDLTGEIKINSRDEIGDLAEHFSALLTHLNIDLNNVNAAAEQVAAGANQLAVSSQSLSQGTTEQASSIQEITATITEIATQTKENALHAGQANELTLQARELAAQGNRQMKEMVKAMAEINDSSGNISKVIKAIDDLAFQTNILALNAAVEAARAGQHGKGFAVVAEEVRNLAARSANAAKETTGMIEDSINKAATGMEIAEETADELNKIEQAVDEAAALVAKIAVASNEQAASIHQINQAIDQVSQVVQNNSATAEETASASEELSSQAELMKNSIRKFKLKKVNYSLGSASVFTPEKTDWAAETAGKEEYYPLYPGEELNHETPRADGDKYAQNFSREEDNYGKY